MSSSFGLRTLASSSKAASALLRPSLYQPTALFARTFASSKFARTKNTNIDLPDFIPDPKNSFKYTTVPSADLEPLKLAHSLYATIHIYDRKFLVTAGDEITLPVRLKDAEVGDELTFDKVSVLGSRDHTFTGIPLVDPAHFNIKGVVVEKTREKRRINERTQRRIRHVRHVIVKNCITKIRITELSVK